jgi:hypothetical protein
LKKHKSTVIATTTFYKSTSELRFELACQFVTEAKTAGYPVVIVDGSPIKEVAGRLRELGAIVFPQLHKGMGPSRREVFFHAEQVAVGGFESSFDVFDYYRSILWTEIEKVDIIRSIPQLVFPIENRQADIAIAQRSKKSWGSWPEFQQRSEQQANAIYNEVFGTENFDPMFGPVAFSIEMAKYFVLRLNQEFGKRHMPTRALVQDTYVQHYAPIVAKFAGERVRSVEIDMIYPPAQRVEEEGLLDDEMRKKRIWQMETLTEAYRAIAKIQEGRRKVQVG